MAPLRQCAWLLVGGLASLASLMGLLPLLPGPRGCSWPPLRIRPWPAWAAYLASLMTFAAIEIGLQISYTLQLTSHFVKGIMLLGAALRALVFAAAARRRDLLSRLAECLRLYATRHPPARWGPLFAAALMVLAFWVVYGVYCWRQVSWGCCPWRLVGVVLVVGGEGLVYSLIFFLVVAPMATLGVLAEGLRSDCAAVASLGPDSDQEAQWRALRVRQQLLQDMHGLALAVSEERCLFALVTFSLTSALWYSDCVYALLSRSISSPSPPMVPLVIGVGHQIFLATLCASCLRFRTESMLIVCLLQGHLAKMVESKVTCREVSCFVDQVLRQSKRYSLLGVLGIDSSTIKSVITAVTSYLVLIVQFDIKVQ
ncbi:Gustatory and pheromone receptor 32a [Frankliniella fusca]|uniref:Gustatory receptor n=1 Tax=Frankliniella fusca TaxID=407009 RepID=A0AAE1HY23_9NEOP|nr:Gustatory and pheromone receptor 32a [Frankliniella fusca]